MKDGEEMATALIPRNDADYDDYLQRLQARFDANIGPLFTTDVPDDLYALYLAALPESERQYHTCHTCRRFVNTFGGLVTIAEDGTARSALWSEEDAPELYQAPTRAMLRAISKARVTGVFLSPLTTWGQPITGPWRHLAVQGVRPFKHLTLTAAQVMAERREDYGTLCRALSDFTAPMLDQAVALLKTESLYRSEKVLGVAEWLQALHAQRAATKDTRKRDNLTWRAVATAPVGYCHPRSSMIGTLLEDIADGMDFAEVSRRFAAKTHPLQYQRPQAAPSAGNIAQAEKIIAQLQAAGALNRRYATLDDLVTLWTPVPRQDAPQAGGVFGHLLSKEETAPAITPPAITMTWEKFARTVLPTARKIAYLVPARHTSYAALVTAADPNAPPIIQWDSEAQRNPVSWYLYSGGSSAAQWGLRVGAWHPVVAVTLQPSMWYGNQTHQGAGVLFVLEAAHDSRGASSGAALFPEILRSELHGVRSTIEAYSRRATIAGDTSASGIMLQKSAGAWNKVFRVDGIDYKLDRWD